MGLSYRLAGVDKTREAWTKVRTQRDDNITTAVIFATMPTSPSDDGVISAEVAPEFFARVYAWERARGAYLTDGDGQPAYLTWEDILDHVGLYTNVFPRITRGSFVATQVKNMREGWLSQPDPRSAQDIRHELHRLIADGWALATGQRPTLLSGPRNTTLTRVTTAR